MEVEAEEELEVKVGVEVEEGVGVEERRCELGRCSRHGDGHAACGQALSRTWSTQNCPS